MKIEAEGGELILKNEFGVPKKTSDQGALAIVNTPAGDEAQHLFLFLGF